MGRRKPKRRAKRGSGPSSRAHEAKREGAPTEPELPKAEDAKSPPRDWAEIGRAYGLLLASAVLMFLGFAGFGVWPLAFVGMVPALLVMDGRTGPWFARSERPTGWVFFRRALFFGYVAYYGGFYWVVNTIVDFGGFPYPLALAFASIYFLYQATEYVLMLWLFRRARDRGFSAALSLVAAFVTAELVFPALFDHFYGNSFHMLPWLVQIADLGGPLLLSGLAMLGNGALYEVVLGRIERRPMPWRAPAAFLGAMVFTLGYSAYRIDEVDRRMADAPTMTVGVVQTNMGIYEKREDPGEGLRRHLAQSRALEEEHNLDLLVWPESAATFPLPRDEGVDAFQAFGQAARFYRVEAGPPPTTPTMFGGLSTERGPDGRLLYNTAFLTDQDGLVQGHYDKTYLLAFGEYLPFGETFPIMYEWSPNTGHFQQGDHVRPLELNGFRIGALVCYEDILPSFVRQVMENDPHVLVNITNDAWFGDTQEPYIHLALAKMRAVEQHRYLVRATNTGVSAIIDPMGRTVAEGPLFGRWQGAAEVHMLEGQTVFQTLGHWPGFLALGTIVYIGFVGRRNPSPSPSPPAPAASSGAALRRRDDEEE
ncbi:MAG: apolipoprotein N-acyltransferase [Sandaracinaceae bacterium]